MFTPSSEWLFLGWEVLDRETGEVVTDSIKFDNPSQLEVRGTVLSPRENLIIHPKCLLLPAVLSVSPGSELPQLANTPIEITFNQQMEEYSLAQEDSIFNYQTISIKYGDKDLAEDYFEKPSFDSQKKVLTLMPKGRLLKQFIESKKVSSLRLSVSLSDKLYVKNSETKIYLVSGNNSFTITYKAEIDETAPVKEYFYISRHKDITNTDTANHYDASSELSESSSKEKVLKNRTTGIIYIYGKYSDTGSGIKSVKVNERRIADKNASPSQDSEIVTKYTENTPGALFIQEGDFINFYIEYHLLSKAGQVLIKTSVADQCENSCSSEDFYLIHTNKENFSVNLSNCGRFVIGYEAFGSDYSMPKVLRICTGPVFDGVSEAKETIYKYVTIPGSDLTMTCSYKDKNGRQRTEEFTYPDAEWKELHYPGDDWNNGDIEKIVTLDVDSLHGLSVKVTISDDIGNQKVIDFTFPDVPPIQVTGKTDVSAQVEYIAPAAESIVRSWIENGEEKSINIGKSSSKFTETISSGTNYKLRTVIGNDDMLIIGPYGSEFSVASLTGSSEIPAVELAAQKYRLNKSSSFSSDHIINITVCLKDNTWTNNKYDSVIMVVPGLQVSKTETRLHEISYGSTEYTLQADAETLTKSAKEINLYGIKNGSVSQSSSFTIEKITSPDYDVEAPRLYRQRVGIDSYKYFVTDLLSEPQSLALLTANGNKIMLADRAKGYDFSEILTFPVWYINEEAIDDYLYYEVTDTKGNSVIRKSERSTNTKEDFSALVYDSSSGKWKFSSGGGSTHYASIFKLQSTDPEWSLKFNHNINYFSSNTAFAFDDNSFIKLVSHSGYLGKGQQAYCDENPYEGMDMTPENGYFGSPSCNYLGAIQYFYATSSSISSLPENRYFDERDNGTIFVASDCPTLLYTAGTKKSLAECSSWSVKDWDNWHFATGEKVFDFSPTDRYQKKYTVPVEQVRDAGCKCYVVVAHYADGSSQLSQIMEIK